MPRKKSLNSQIEDVAKNDNGIIVIELGREIQELDRETSFYQSLSVRTRLMVERILVLWEDRLKDPDYKIDGAELVTALEVSSTLSSTQYRISQIKRGLREEVVNAQAKIDTEVSERRATRKRKEIRPLHSE